MLFNLGIIKQQRNTVINHNLLKTQWSSGYGGQPVTYVVIKEWVLNEQKVDIILPRGLTHK